MINDVPVNTQVSFLPRLPFPGGILLQRKTHNVTNLRLDVRFRLLRSSSGRLTPDALVGGCHRRVAALRAVVFGAVVRRFRVTFSFAAEAAVQRVGGDGDADDNHITAVVDELLQGNAFAEHEASLDH